MSLMRIMPTLKMRVLFLAARDSNLSVTEDNEPVGDLLALGTRTLMSGSAAFKPNKDDFGRAFTRSSDSDFRSSATRKIDSNPGISGRTVRPKYKLTDQFKSRRQYSLTGTNFTRPTREKI